MTGKKSLNETIFGVIALPAAMLVLSSCSSADKLGLANSATPPAIAATTTTHLGKALAIVSIPHNSQAQWTFAVAQAGPHKLDYTVNTTGEVLANSNLLSHVNSPVTGRIIQVLVNVGDHVAEKQPLVIIRSNDIEQAEADLLQSESQAKSDLKKDLLQLDCDLDTAKAQVKLSESNFNRLKSLIDEQIASRADYESARTQFDKDKIVVDSLTHKRQATIALSAERMRMICEPIKQKLRVLGLSEAAIQKTMRTREVDPDVPIFSPETGVVSERSINVGELADPGKCLFTIGNFDSLWIKADINERDISKVQQGQPITLEVDSFPGSTFRGKLNYVADSINPDTRTLPVRAEVSNRSLKLKPKMFARMNILVGEHAALCVPKDAVQDAGSSKVVYVPLSNGKFEERQVEPGAENGDYIEILKGLHAGEKVVTKGSFELRSQSLKATS